ncbi:hypothetical protein ACN47E_003558 [Coniothyrium glycines]
MEMSQGPNDYLIPTPQQWLDPRFVLRQPTEEFGKQVEDDDVCPGRILWLPSKDDLPKGAVKRVRGKGAIEEGIYCHPVVVVSRPSQKSHVAHVQLVTSLQGKRLDQLYYKPTEFHASRRSWYLPISPTAEHPDANSKKSKKRFPTLDIADGAALRWDSYVNIRYVYEIEWSYLRVYANPDMPNVRQFRFERESLIRLLAKTKLLTLYEQGPQALRRSASEPVPTRRRSPHGFEHIQQDQKPHSALFTAQTTTSPRQSDFHSPELQGYRMLGERPDIPPESLCSTLARIGLRLAVIIRPLDHILKQTAVGSEGTSVAKSPDSNVARHPLSQVWINIKGVSAVFVAVRSACWPYGAAVDQVTWTRA